MRKQVLAVLLLLVVMISGCAEVSTAPIEKSEPVTETKTADESRTDSVFPSESMVLVYKSGQEKLNSLYYQVKEQRRCLTWLKNKNLTLRNSSSRS